MCLSSFCRHRGLTIFLFKKQRPGTEKRARKSKCMQMLLRNHLHAQQILSHGVRMHGTDIALSWFVTDSVEFKAQ